MKTLQEKEIQVVQLKTLVKLKVVVRSRLDLPQVLLNTTQSSRSVYHNAI